jgi:hypothetical protein
LAVCDDGLVIDLARMKRIGVDPAQRTATVQAGVLWGELDAATQAFGLATTGGIVSHTGVSGLTLGGGIGWLMRRHGLTVDNLLAADVVTADGRHVTTSERDHPDLFWGLRGGGGGLGVVTSFTYRLHSLRQEVLAGPVIWALEDAPEVLAAYRSYVASAPPEVATRWCCGGHRPRRSCRSSSTADPYAWSRCSRSASPPRPSGCSAGCAHPVARSSTSSGAGPYAGLQSMFDTTVPHGWHYYWKSAGLRQLNDAVISTMVDHASRAASPWSYALLFHLGGAVAGADPDATAYSRRDVPHELNVNAVWLPGQAIGPAESTWARNYIAELEPHHAGVYLNFLDHDDQDCMAAAFTATAYTRLTELRRRFDPDQVFQPHHETTVVPG